MAEAVKRIYLHGGPQDGRFIHVSATASGVEVVVAPLDGTAPMQQEQRFDYQPRGRHTLQGVEIFEVV